MGSKGGDSPPPVDYSMFNQANQDMEYQLQRMQQQMENYFNNPDNATPPPPEVDPIPIPDPIAPIDWDQIQESLAADVKDSYLENRAKSRGRIDTILTSSILDSEDPKTTIKTLLGA
jgi:hypothetical protein